MASHEDERIQRVKEFFESGLSVCPFARKYADQIRIVYVRDNHESDATQILNLLRSPDMMAVTYVFESDTDNHEKERARAVSLFKGLYKSLFIAEHDQAAQEHLSDLERELNQAFSLTSKINPFLSYKYQSLFAIAMNPLYQAAHPRWAPCPIVVITRQGDVVAVPKPTVDVIRQRIIEKIGRLYDADELYLLPH